VVPINVVIADDHPSFREGVAKKLSELGLNIVGQASHGVELISTVEETIPDVVVTDYSFGEDRMDGMEATKIIHSRYPAMGIIAHTGYYGNFLIVRMLQAGARGFVVKTADQDVLEAAIQKVYRGDCYYCQTSSKAISEMVRQGEFNLQTLEYKAFTPRETTIIELVCEGYSSKQIARKINSTVDSVNSSRKLIHEKIGKSGTAAIVQYAIKYGIRKIG
jgi:DNA-binding NarL/FixJ family response regulator